MFIEARIIINDKRHPIRTQCSHRQQRQRPLFLFSKMKNVYKQIQVRIGTNDLGFTQLKFFHFEEITTKQKL